MFVVVLIAIGSAGLMIIAFGWVIKEYIRKGRRLERYECKKVYCFKGKS